MVPERRSLLVSLAGFCSLGLAGCSAFDDPSETDPETTAETTAPSSQSTPGSTGNTTPETPTATLTPTGTESPTVTKVETKMETPTATEMETQRNPQFTASDDDSRYFGGSVGISGATAVVGAQGTERDVDGVAYVFVRSNGSWAQQAKLVPDALESSSARFPVAVSGDTVLVRNYLYARTDGSWTRETTLVPDEDASPEITEISVAVDDDTAVVGNPDHDDEGEGEGRVYVFQRSDASWDHQSTLVHPDGEWGDGFGSAVSIEGDTVVVGSPIDDTPNGRNAGTVHVFRRAGGTWGQQATLALEDGDEDDSFGTSVSLSGDAVVVSADRDDDPNDEHSGSAYVFERTDGDWRRQAKLVPTEATRDGWLGNYGDAVALTGDTALLSGRWNPTPEIQDGVESVSLFSRDGESWSQTRTLDSETAGSGGPLGPVALTEDTALVGSPMAGHHGEPGVQGVVYVYHI